MKNPVKRILIILGLVLLLIIAGKFTPVGAWFNLENISITIKNTGFWGFLMFTTLFILGSFLQAPAMLFVLAALLVYGPITGVLLSYVGVVVAMSVNYLVIRRIGGSALNEIKNKRVQQMLSKLDRNPLVTVILLRLILWASPVLNYTLAMTPVKPRHYIVGSSVGIILPLVLFSAMVHFFRELILSSFL